VDFEGHLEASRGDQDCYCCFFFFWFAISAVKSVLPNVFFSLSSRLGVVVLSSAQTVSALAPSLVMYCNTCILYRTRNVGYVSDKIRWGYYLALLIAERATRATLLAGLILFERRACLASSTLTTTNTVLAIDKLAQPSAHVRRFQYVGSGFVPPNR
jgi:hypothetical protein